MEEKLIFRRDDGPPCEKCRGTSYHCYDPDPAEENDKAPDLIYRCLGCGSVGSFTTRPRRMAWKGYDGG